MERGARNSDGSVVGIEAVTGDVEALRQRTRTVCTKLNQTHGDLVDLTVDLLERSLWAEGGIRSPEHWLMVRAGLSPATARDIVRLARRAGELHEARSSLSAGTLSLDQASVLTRHVPATHSQAATVLAEECTVPQLRRALSRHGFQDDPNDDRDGDETPGTPGEKAGPNSVREDPVLTMSTNSEGVFSLRFSAPASVGALVEQAIREAKDALFASGSTQATLADALVEVCNRSLTTLEGTSRSRRYRVNVHLDTEGGWLPGVGRLPDHMLRAVTCDGTLVPVWETDGHPVISGGRCGSCRSGCGASSSPGTAAARIPDASLPVMSTSTTSCTGPTAVGPTSTTWSRCAPSITTRITRAPSASRPTSTSRVGSSSPAAEAGGSSRCTRCPILHHPPDRPATTTRRWMPTVTRRSPRRPGRGRPGSVSTCSGSTSCRTHRRRRPPESPGSDRRRAEPHSGTRPRVVP